MTGFDNQGLALGEVYGFRWWNYHAGDDLAFLRGGEALPGPLLRGSRGYWTPGENAARCLLGAHNEPAPQENCGCGMWAYWTPEAAPIPAGRRVAGVVKGYGDTLIGDQGCRCQLTKIVALSFEKVERSPDPTVPVVQGWVPAPPEGVRWGQLRGAMDTYMAFGGRPRYVPDTRPPNRPMVDDLAAQAALEIRLGERYGVPVYTTIDIMLAMHPLTTDYLPQSEIPGLLETDWPALKAKLDEGAAALSDAIKNALIPHTISGADAIRQLNKRLKDAP